MRILWTALCGILFTINTFAQGPSKEGPSALSSLFYQAETYRLTGRTSLAAQAYEKLLREDATHETALYQLGRIAFQRGDFLSAKELLERGVAHHPGNEWMWQLYGFSAAKLGDYEAGIGAFRKLQQMRPDKTEYVDNALSVAVEAGAFETAIEIVQDFESQYGRTPQSVEQQLEYYQRAQDSKGALALLKESSKEQPDRPEYQVLIGQWHTANGKEKKAVKLLSSSIETFPTEAGLYLERARALQQLGEFEEAFADLELALTYPGLDLKTKGTILLSYYAMVEQNPQEEARFDRMWHAVESTHAEEPGWSLLKAEFFKAKEMPDSAMVYYIEAVDRGFDVVEVFDNALQLGMGTGQKAKSLELLDRMYDLYGQDQQLAKFMVAQWSAWNAWKELAPVAAELAEVELDPEDKRWLHSSAGYGYYQMDQIDLCIEHYEKSLAISRDAGTLNNYAWALAKSDTALNTALVLTEESNAKQANEPIYLDTWAFVLFKLGQFEQAREKMELALQLSQSAASKDMYQRAAKIEEALGNDAKAQKYREKAKSLNEH